MKTAKRTLKMMEQDVGSFLSKPSYEFGSDGTSCLFHFSDPRTMRMVQRYIQNMRNNIDCKPWLLDTGDSDPFTGQYHLIVSWRGPDGNPLPNAKKAIQFVCAKWLMAKAGKKYLA